MVSLRPNTPPTSETSVAIYIETAGNKCPKQNNGAGLCQAGLCAMK